LLKEGASPSASDDNGWTPLHFAAQSRLDLTRLLLEAGATVDATNSHGNTPLGTAVFNSRGQGAIIALLREYGASPALENRHGVSPLRLARNIGNFDVAQFFKDLPEEDESQKP
jgi:ankyrin repeat protein